MRLLALIEPHIRSPDEQQRLGAKLLEEAEKFRSTGGILLHVKRHSLRTPPTHSSSKADSSRVVFSANLASDALTIRRVAFQEKASEVFILCPADCLDDLAFLVSRMSTGDFFPVLCPVDFHFVRSASDRIQRRLWVDVPLAADKGDLADFPTEIYENASADHKHYDNLSYGVISGQILISGFALSSLNDDHAGLSDGLIVAAALIGIWVLWWFYARSASWARLARTILATIEISYGRSGFSANTAVARTIEERAAYGTLGWRWDVGRVVLLLTAGMSLLLIVALGWLALEGRQPSVPTDPATLTQPN